MKISDIKIPKVSPRPTYDEGRHNDGLRGLDQVPLGNVFTPGRFGRMFDRLPPHVADDAALTDLGRAMTDDRTLPDNEDIPQGFTYLGQFVDHDITFDTTALSEQPRDPQAIFNFRTPQLELDSLYGTGPRGMPHLYERDDSRRFVIGQTNAQPGLGDPSIPPGQRQDLPRMAGTGFAVIGDPRNDENLVVAQTHLAFMKFHNAVVDREGVDFEGARKIVRWHYQWIVLHDFVRRLVGQAVLDDVMDNGRKYYCPAHEAFIPVEFAVAAYRLGHSMVREGYDYNRVFTFRDGGVTTATLDLLFKFSGRSSEGLPTDLPIPPDWPIDWRRFFAVGAGAEVGFSRRLDPRLAPTLQRIPPANFSLAVANLLRGKARGLPSGQAVAAAMGFQPLAPADFDGGAGHPDEVAVRHNLHEQTPLWYYILKEAEKQKDGRSLGDVGARIVAEVFVGLLELDSESYLAQSPAWTPTLPGAAADDFTMADLLAYVGDLNPIG